MYASQWTISLHNKSLFQSLKHKVIVLLVQSYNVTYLFAHEYSCKEMAKGLERLA